MASSVSTSVLEALASARQDPRGFLLLCSGGQDSMVLATVLIQAGIPVELFHVNYGLRGAESEGDEAFVRQWAVQHAVVCHVRRVPEGFGEESDIQARARSFRYTEARELLAARDLQSMLVAHHADDAAETFLFHAARGTGLDGLVALAPVSDQLIRPLWNVSKSQIDTYARKKQIAWREDSSNAGDKYTRNHLRHHALPALREAMPQATEGLRTTLHHLRELQSFVDAAIKRESILYLGKSKSVPGALVLYRDVLDHPHSSVIIWYILRSMGGFDYEAVRSLGNSQVGAKLEKGGWQLWAEREGLVLTPVPTEPIATLESLHSLHRVTGPLWDGSRWQAEVEWTGEERPYASLEDLGSLRAPVLCLERVPHLVWRPWQEGDYILPLGMKGRKKLSDVLTEGKVPAMYRKAICVMAEAATPGEVFWVPGMRLSRRVAVSEADSSFWRLTEHPSAR